jgi:hypothetical protein
MRRIEFLELRWLPSQMTDGAFKATLALFAWEAEKCRPRFLLIDATQFHHQFGSSLMQWRDDCIMPRYGAAGARKFAFHVPAGFPTQWKLAVRKLSKDLLFSRPLGFPSASTRSIGSESTEH